MFDHTTLLPEYILTYTLSSPCPEAAAEQAQQGATGRGCSAQLVNSTQSCNDPLLQLCAQPLSRWLPADSKQQASGPQHLHSRCTEALAAIALPACPRLPRLSPAALAVTANTTQVLAVVKLLQCCTAARAYQHAYLS